MRAVLLPNELMHQRQASAEIGPAGNAPIADIRLGPL